MTKSFCGKDCDTCNAFMELTCSGCKDGNKQAAHRECEIVECCAAMKFEACEQCYNKETCTKLDSRDNMQSHWSQVKKTNKENAIRKAPFMQKWLMVLLGLSIATLLLGNVLELILGESSYVVMFANAILGIAYAVVLLKLSVEEDRYRMAAYYMLAATIIGLVVGLIFQADTSAIAVISASGVMLFGFIGLFYEFMGHAHAVKDASVEMFDKWQNLWKWYVRIIGGTIGCLVLMMLSPVLGAIAMLILAVILVVVSILQIVYLYQSAKIFQQIMK